MSHIPAGPTLRSSEYKLCVCGAGAVGKSALTIQFINGAFITAYDPTIEDSYRKQHHVDGLPALLDILDTAGQEDYSALRSQYMRKGHGFLLIFSITDRLSFDEIMGFYNQILMSQDRDYAPCVLVGNKCDLGDHMRQVSTQEAKALAKSIGCEYIETSAKQNLRVHQVFESLVRSIRRERAEESSDPMFASRRRLPRMYGGGGGCTIL